MLLVGTEQNARSHSNANDPETKRRKTEEGVMDLHADEQMPETSLESVQEKFMLEETAAFLRKVLTAAEGSVESQKILLF
jgi:hypothetical protein